MNIRSLTFAQVVMIAAMLIAYSPSLQDNIENAAPYIYYYSAAKAGFVTERADGSDSQILSTFEFPDNKIISGPGWSPSGKWLAWTISDVEGGSLSQSVAYLVNRDGNQINLFPQADVKGATAHVEMLWSPVNDLLLVNYRYDVYDAGNQISSKNEFFVYDPNTQSHLSLPQAGIINEWSPSGDYIVAYSDDRSNSQFTIYPVVTNTNTINRSFHYPYDCSYANLPHWSADRKIAYITSDQKTIAVEDIEHNKSYLFTLPVGNVRFIDWSPDGQYALIYLSETCTMTNTALWLLDIPAQRISQVTPYPQFQIPVSQQMGSYSRFTQEYNFYSATAWNKNSSYAVALSIQNVPYVIGSDPFDVHEIAESKTAKTDQMIWSTINPLQILLGNDDSIESYTIGNNTPVNLVENMQSSYMSMSADGHYLGYLNNAAIYIDDINTGVSVTFNLIHSENSPVSNADLYWHPKENWLFAMGIITSVQIRLIDVLNATGDVHRQLGVCTTTPSCFGWLPNIKD